MVNMDTTTALNVILVNLVRIFRNSASACLETRIRLSFLGLARKMYLNQSMCLECLCVMLGNSTFSVQQYQGLFLLRTFLVLSKGVLLGLQVVIFAESNHTMNRHKTILAYR
jgi:hypothetical protein